MKKIIILMIILLCIAFFGCDNKSNEVVDEEKNIQIDYKNGKIVWKYEDKSVWTEIANSEDIKNNIIEEKNGLEAPETGEFVFKKNEDLVSYTLTGYNGTDYGVTIPDTYNGFPVTRIYTAFNNFSSVKKVVIGKNIKVIDSAFQNCNSLEEVVIKGDLETINNGFYKCLNLKKINIPSSLKELKGYVFDGCNELDYVEYEGCAYIGDDNNPHLILLKALENPYDSLSLNNNCVFINSFAFRDKTLPEILFLPDSIKYIGAYAFRDCYGLKKVDFYNVREIDNYAFFGCNDLESVYISNSVEIIGDCAISSRKSLTVYTSYLEKPDKWDPDWGPQNVIWNYVK